MGYVVDTLLPCLKHPSKGIDVSCDELKLLLWYTPTKQSYIQRNNAFDNTFLSSSTSNAYVALLLKEVYDVPTIHLADGHKACHAAIDLLTASDLGKPQFYISQAEKSLMLDFWEKARNSLAHGTFNPTGTINYMLGQEYRRPNSDANFLLQTNQDLFQALKAIWDKAQQTINGQLETFKYTCLQAALNLKQIDGMYFSQSVERYVIIDDTFLYNSNPRTADVQNLLLKYDGDKKIDVIIGGNPGRTSEEKLSSPAGNARAVYQSKLIDYYGLTQVQFISKSEEEEP